MRILLLLLFLSFGAPSQPGGRGDDSSDPSGSGPAADRFVIVLDDTQRAEAARGLVAGIRAGLVRLRPGAEVDVLSVKAARAKGAFEGARAVFLHVRTGHSAPLAAAAVSQVPLVFDLGAGILGGAKGVLAPCADLRVLAENAAWWLTGTFQHHVVAVAHGRGRVERNLARLFQAAVKERHPGKICRKPRTLPSSEKALGRWLEKERKLGTTAWFFCGTRQEALPLIRAAALIRPRPVVMLAPSVLAPPKKAPRGEAGSFLPEGVVVLDRRLPEKAAFEAFPEDATLLAMGAKGGPWALLGFDAAVTAARALAAAQEREEEPREVIRKGIVAAPRGGFRATGEPDAAFLDYIPLLMTGERLLPFPPQDPEDPVDRPKRVPYRSESGPGSIAQWNSLSFKPQPGTVVCFFNWGPPRMRTIESDLLKLKLSTGGRQPVVDHLVREKIMARLMSITGEKFGLNPDGTPRSGGLRISMTARVDRKKDKVKLVWPVIVAGDDPEAGGRAFGSYCIVYSTFIYRTIFSKYDLLDDPVGLGELSRLVGMGRPRGEYVLGSREDVLYRLIDKFAGSMALTAAHEIGHLCGLSHDTVDPRSIMNVKEGAGMDYPLGRFIPAHWKLLEKRLGIHVSAR